MLQGKTQDKFCSFTVIRGNGSVSYTHLDVYKRQDINNIKERIRFKTIHGLITIDVYKRQQLILVGYLLVQSRMAYLDLLDRFLHV